ncbi:unnamed protein product [Mucor fragilis]
MSKRLFSQNTSVDDDQGDGDFSKSAIPLSKKEPDMVNGIPVSGEDYLLVVRRQAKKCAQTVVAPRPTKMKKVNLPSHFQFFDNDTSKIEDQASNEWRKGFSKSFRSYQKHMQHNKPLSNSHKEITSIDEAFKILYTQKKDSITFIPTLSQHTILRLLQYHIQWLSTTADIALQVNDGQSKAMNQRYLMHGFIVSVDIQLTSIFGSCPDVEKHIRASRSIKRVYKNQSRCTTGSRSSEHCHHHHSRCLRAVGSALKLPNLSTNRYPYRRKWPPTKRSAR